MTTETSPTGEPAAPEHVGLAIRAVIAGALAGLGLIAAVLWLVRTLQVTGVAPLTPTPSDTIANLILLGWLGSACLSGILAWSLMAPLTSAYRRGAFAMVAGFGTLLLAVVTWPVDSFFGRWGLLALSGATAVAFLFLLRRAPGSRA